MLIEHQGKRPNIDPTAYIAPTLTRRVITGLDDHRHDKILSK
jgi:hypothetical protein